MSEFIRHGTTEQPKNSKMELTAIRKEIEAMLGKPPLLPDDLRDGKLPDADSLIEEAPMSNFLKWLGQDEE